MALRLVIDTNVLIPGGEKDKETIESIKEFGDLLPEVARLEEIILYLSTEIINEYQLVPAQLRKFNLKKQLPKFHSSLDRILPIFRYYRTKKCRPISLEKHTDLKLKFHVVETTKLNYDVNEFIDDSEDEKFLKLTLALAKSGEIFVISVDRESILKLNVKKLYEKYKEAKNIRIYKLKDFVERVILPLLVSKRLS